MSRHDPRRGIYVSLPEALQLKLVTLTPDHRPLPHLLRAALRAGMALKPVAAQQGKARPLLLQLSKGEMAGVKARAAESGQDVPETIVQLAFAGAAALERKKSK